MELEMDDEDMNGHLDRDRQDSLPLLTGVEAPSITLASDGEFVPEDLLESARPRSGLHNAFMNMANSIMYVESAMQRILADISLAALALSANLMPFVKQVLSQASYY